MEPLRPDEDSNWTVLPPKTVEELIQRYNLTHTSSLTDVCGVCKEKYGTGDSSELPVILPNCTHIYGSACLIKWVNKHSNTCPGCREPVIDDEEEIIRPGLQEDALAEAYGEDSDPMDEDSSAGEGSIMHEVNSPPPQTEEEDRVFESLTAWRSNWHMGPDNHNAHPSHGAEHAEVLYGDLCEAIVCYLEDPTTPQAWLQNRLPLADILQHTTFYDFYLNYIDPVTPMAPYVNRLHEIPRTMQNIRLIENHMHGQNLHTHRWNCANAATHERFAAWHRRIEQAHHRQLGILTITRNSRAAREREAESEGPRPLRRSTRIHSQENPARNDAPPLSED